MSYVEICPGKFIEEKFFNRLVQAAADINLEDCIDVKKLNDEQFQSVLTEVPRRPIDITHLSREDRRKVLFGPGG